MKYKSLLLLILGVVVLGGFFTYMYMYRNTLNNDNYTATKLTTPSGDIINIKIADTEEKRIQGLSETKELKEDQGMWFTFPEEGYYSIWMKDMNFSIDILWLNSDLEIIHTESEVSPDTYRSSLDAEIFISPVPAQYVLEIPSGMSEKYELSLNSKVHLIGE
jgi:uncharacterized membrane protein (UPF0127 family)